LHSLRPILQGSSFKIIAYKFIPGFWLDFDGDHPGRELCLSLGRATSPPALLDGTGSAVAPQDRATSPPSMVGIISAAIPTESDIFVHVLMNVLKQPSDGPLAWALDKASINEINDLLTLDHQSRNALMYELNDGTVKPLPISYKNLLRVLKIFADYCQDTGMPIKDWTVVTKRDFDKFRTSHARLALSEKSDAFSNSAPTWLLLPPLPSRMISFPSSRKGSSIMHHCSSC